MNMENWQLQDAKNRFSEIVNEALRNGPQIVTRHGKKTVVIMSVEQYQRLVKPKINIIDFFQESPFRGEDLDLSRQKDSAREVVI
ncbi:MAG: type II toxin-antitoxin system prevent-host-death family antitoxin [Deltaproteobacteria bacterium]|nr:MAG: type II toxin-antitoxin system prevent-host-death family antitoxin [Deltaproteobacteria bacterium]